MMSRKRKLDSQTSAIQLLDIPADVLRLLLAILPLKPLRYMASTCRSLRSLAEVPLSKAYVALPSQEELVEYLKTTAEEALMSGDTLTFLSLYYPTPPEPSSEPTNEPTSEPYVLHCVIDDDNIDGECFDSVVRRIKLTEEHDQYIIDARHYPEGLYEQLIGKQHPMGLPDIYSMLSIMCRRCIPQKYIQRCLDSAHEYAKIIVPFIHACTADPTSLHAITRLTLMEVWLYNEEEVADNNFTVGLDNTPQPIATYATEFSNLACRELERPLGRHCIARYVAGCLLDSSSFRLALASDHGFTITILQRTTSLMCTRYTASTTGISITKLEPTTLTNEFATINYVLDPFSVRTIMLRRGLSREQSVEVAQEHLHRWKLLDGFGSNMPWRGEYSTLCATRLLSEHISIDEHYTKHFPADYGLEDLNRLYLNVYYWTGYGMMCPNASPSSLDELRERVVTTTKALEDVHHLLAD